MKNRTTMKVVLDKGAYMPTRAHSTDAGYDLRTPERTIVYSKSSVVIDTGVHIQIPKGKCGLLVSKSGLNTLYDITSTGLIDEGYTGSIKVKLYNYGEVPYIFNQGDKISQLVILDYYGAELEEVDELEETERGEKGFGSSGR